MTRRKVKAVSSKSLNCITSPTAQSPTASHGGSSTRLGQAKNEPAGVVKAELCCVFLSAPCYSTRFARISPESYRNFTRISPEFRPNFAGTSTWRTLKRGTFWTRPSHSRRRAYARSPFEDSRLFGPSPWKILATTYEQKRFLSNPAPGENLLSGNLVMETWCTGVCEKNTPPDKKTGWNISFESTKSGAGLQFLLLGRMAKAHGKGVFLLQTPAYRTRPSRDTTKKRTTATRPSHSCHIHTYVCIYIYIYIYI